MTFLMFIYLLNTWMSFTIAHLITQLLLMGILVKQTIPWLCCSARLKMWCSLIAPLWTTLVRRYQQFKVMSSLEAMLHLGITLASMVGHCSSVKTQPCTSEQTHQFTSLTIMHRIQEVQFMLKTSA